MASYLQIEGISKSYGPKVLFDNIGFNINEGDKMALIAPNGAGKTSLLRILAGKDKSDSGGKITFLKDIRIAFLPQESDFDPEKTIMEQAMADSSAFISDHDALASFQLRLRQLLTNFGLLDLEKKMSQLSGGEAKRVALARILATEADFYIMDEPTNHLDIDAIEYLEGFLSRSRCTLLMVTHDRYFLDHVCNTILELDHGALYTYRGDYQAYLEKRTERIENMNAETQRLRNTLRRELEWMRATPCARTGKAKYRKDAFYELKDRAENVYRTDKVSMAEMGGASRLGSKIFDCKGLGYEVGGRKLLDGFSYNFQRYERVGIVGPNGAGKSTFLNILTHGAVCIGTSGEDSILTGTLTGSLERGESLKIGYYRQKGISFKEDQTVLQTVNDTHLLSQFLFPHDMLNNPVSKLSGGERRRLYLLTILKEQPNVLLMDEPTNDLDIVTLDILEEYLMDFKGTLIIVSHDRHFLDRLTSHLLILPGDGSVKDFLGTYSEYRQYMIDWRAEKRSREKAEKQPDAVKARPEAERKRRLSFKEKREMDQLEADMKALGEEKTALEEAMNSGGLAYDKLEEASLRYAEVKRLLDEKELRWLELSEIAG